MDVSLKVNSSLMVGVVAGAAVGALLGGHVRQALSGGWCLYLVALRKARAGGSGAGAGAGSGSGSALAIAGANGAGAGAKIGAARAEGDANGDADADGADRAEEREAFWFTEGLTSVYRVEMSLKSILFDARSAFQRVQVIETEQFGRTLVMDGQTQSASADEHIYHESLVHPAMLLHEGPKSVFIGGGGEFATAREVLRHKTVERCVMVDIDKVACDICRDQLPEWNDGAFEDPRFHVEYQDARAWLEGTDEMFDIVIMDICDPVRAFVCDLRPSLSSRSSLSCLASFCAASSLAWRPAARPGRAWVDGWCIAYCRIGRLGTFRSGTQKTSTADREEQRKRFFTRSRPGPGTHCTRRSSTRSCARD